ncbi:MAG TPA: hypothetical protein VHA33_29350 [Candidatus Angelobacter sp.]|nr:hypothetical protein [Candidatus Angelobacter sp.]
MLIEQYHNSSNPPESNHGQNAVAPSTTARESRKAHSTLTHAFDYLVGDPDAARLVSRALHEHAAAKYHRCQACAKYYSHGSDRPPYPTSFVPTAPNGGIRVEMEANVPTPPPGLLIALSWSMGYLRHADVRRIYHFIWLGSESCCGVFGDGSNGCYEWFLWIPSIPAKLQTSNLGYGCTASALRGVLNVAHDRGDL